MANPVAIVFLGKAVFSIFLVFYKVCVLKICHFRVGFRVQMQ